MRCGAYVTYAMRDKEILIHLSTATIALPFAIGGEGPEEKDGLGVLSTSIHLIVLVLVLVADYVHGGGRYLGLCAGAYYACNRVEFEQGSPMEVQGDRELQFFPGIARGAAYPGEHCRIRYIHMTMH